jgi:hypothetical protein
MTTQVSYPKRREEEGGGGGVSGGIVGFARAFLYLEVYRFIGVHTR